MSGWMEEGEKEARVEMGGWVAPWVLGWLVVDTHTAAYVARCKSRRAPLTILASSSHPVRCLHNQSP